jgi:hypothetical protein
MTESIAGHMIELNFHYQLGPQRLPLGTPLGTPTARDSGRFAGKARHGPQRLQPAGQRPPFEVRDRGGEPDMIESASL